MCSKLVLEIKQLRPGIPIVLISGYTLLTPVQLIHVTAHVGKGATLDDLLIEIQTPIRKATLLKGTPGSAQGFNSSDAATCIRARAES
jgi:hypothetical protein